MTTAAATAMRDQVHAARRDAHRTLHQAAIRHGGTANLVAASPWCRELLASVLGPNIRTARLCRHLRGKRSPEIVFLAAHRRRVECAPCAHRAYRATIGTPEDRTCDRCRILVAAGQVEVVTWAVGPLVVSAGHCHGCRDAVRGPGVAT